MSDGRRVREKEKTTPLLALLFVAFEAPEEEEVQQAEGIPSPSYSCVLQKLLSPPAAPRCCCDH